MQLLQTKLHLFNMTYLADAWSQSGELKMLKCKHASKRVVSLQRPASSSRPQQPSARLQLWHGLDAALPHSCCIAMSPPSQKVLVDL